MLAGRKSDGAILRPRPIDHSDVFMGVGDSMDIEETRRDEGPGAITGGRRPLADEFHFEAAFFPGFPKRSLFRVFVQLNMPSQRQPTIQLPVVNQQNALAT